MKNLIFFLCLFSLSALAEITPPGKLFGFVRDEASGKPLVNAEVLLTPSGVRVLTDSSGYFSVISIKPGEYNLRVQAVDYYPHTRYVSLSSGRAEEVNFELLKRLRWSGDTLRLKDRVVQKKSTQEPLSRGHEATGTFRITAHEIYRSPSSLGDFSRIIQTLPGVMTVNDQINDLIVRGGGAGENSFLLEGIPSLKINHFDGNGTGGGRIGNVNVYFVDQIAFHNGAFAARYPDKMSSVTELRFRNGNLLEHTGMVTFDMAGLGAVVEGPYTLGEQKGSYALTGRYSVLDLLERVGFLDVGGIPEYQNGHFKLYQPLSRSSHLKFNLLSGRDHIEICTEAKDTSLNIASNEIDFSSHNVIAGIGLETNHPSGKSRIVLHYNRRFEKVDLWYTRLDDKKDKIRITDSLDIYEASTEQAMGINADYRHFFGDHLTLNTGLQTQYFLNRHELDLGRFPTYQALPGRDTVILMQKVNRTTEPGGIGQASVYAELLYQTHLLDLYLGYRHFYEEYTDNHGLGPRAGLKIHLNREHILKAAFGMHPQAHPWLEVEKMKSRVDNSLPFNLQAVAGWEWRLPQGWFCSAEGYEKRTFNLVRSSQYLNSDKTHHIVLDSGKTISRGFELYLKKSLIKNFFGSVTYNFNHTMEQNYKKEWIENAFSIPHSFNIALGYELSNKYGISGRYSIASGKPYTPVDTARSRAMGAIVYDLDKLFTERSPEYSRLDIRFDFRENYRHFSIISFIEISNVLAHKNEFGRYWSRVENDIIAFEGFGFFPVCGVVVAF